MRMSITIIDTSFGGSTGINDYVLSNGIKVTCENYKIQGILHVLNNPAEFGLVTQEKYDKVTQENEQLKTIIDQFKKMRSGIENLQILQLQQQNEQLREAVNICLKEIKGTENAARLAPESEYKAGFLKCITNINAITSDTLQVAALQTNKPT